MSQLLGNIIDEVKKPFLSEEDNKLLNEVFSSGILNKQEKARRAFEIVLEARLRNVPANEANILRKALKEVKTNYSIDVLC